MTGTAWLGADRCGVGRLDSGRLLRHSPTACALALGALLTPAAAQADDDLDALLEESLVETATRQAESVATAPAVTTVVTADDLRRYGIRTVDEAINFLSVGLVSENPNGAAEVGARGVLITSDYGAHLLVLVDGHALNEVWGGTAYFERGAGVPFELIDRIEIIAGPGSVLYGSNAMLGVINIVTKRARDFEGLHAVVESELFPSSLGLGWSLRSSAGAGFEFDVGKQRGALTFMAEYYTLEGPPFAFGPQTYGEDGVTGQPRYFSGETPAGIWGGVADETFYSRVPSAYAKLTLGDFEMKLRGALYERSYPAHGGNFDDAGNYELDRWLSLDATYNARASKQASFLTRLYGDLYDYQQFYPSTAPEDCLDGQNDGCLYYLKGSARWAGLEETLSLDWLNDGRLTTLVGLDGRVKNIVSEIDIRDRLTDASPGLLTDLSETELALGIFAQQALVPTSWLAFNIGARVDIDQRYGTFLSPRGSIALMPWRGGVFKAIYSRAFRGPTAFERYYADKTSQIEANALRPEVVRSVEGVFEQRFGAHRIEFDGFRGEYRDLVTNVDLTQAEIDAAIAAGQLEEEISAAEQTRNTASIETYGFSGRVEGSFLSGRLRYAGSVTRAHARSFAAGDDEGAPLTASAQVFGNARLSYDLADGKPVLGLATRFAGERPSGYTNTDGTEALAPATVEIKGTVSGPIKPLPGLAYRVSGGYVFGGTHPYAVGPTQKDDGSIELMPVQRVKLAAGLSYDYRF